MVAFITNPTHSWTLASSNIFADASFVCEASSEEEKYRWMLMIHFVKSRLQLDNAANGHMVNGVNDSDFLIKATHVISQKSNNAIDQFFENMEREKQTKTLTQ